MTRCGQRSGWLASADGLMLALGGLVAYLLADWIDLETRGGDRAPMRIKVIGGVQVKDDNGAFIDLQPKTEAALVALVLSGDALSADQLAEFLWPPNKSPNEPPRDVHKAAVDQISKLLQSRLITRSKGRAGGRPSYGLALTKKDYVDIDDFRDTVKRAESIPSEYAWNKCGVYEAALNLWTDPPLAGLPDTPAMNRLLRRVRDERLDAAEEWAKAMLQAGRYKELARDLPPLVEANPTREFLLGPLMRALYLAGRPGEAQDIYTEIRRENGTEPSRQLQTLIEQIRRGDPDLKPHQEPPPETDLTLARTENDPDQVSTPQIDTSVPHSARIFNYWLGGKDHYDADRSAGERFHETFPDIVNNTRIARQFLVRVIRYLAADAGIRQFLDVGTGLPTVDNTHEVAQRVAPDSRIVYVDNDPLVLVHARALLTSSPEGATDYLDADVHKPDEILKHAARTLDLSRPVAVVLMGILAHIDDYDEARAIARRLLDGLPPGSYLAVRDGTDTNAEYTEAIRQYNATGAVPYHLRSPDQIAGFLDGLESVPPGVVSCPHWRPDTTSEQPEIPLYGGIGRKPG